MGRAGERAQGDGLIVGIEQAVELSAARAHASREHRLGQAVLAHDGGELARDDSLDGLGRDLLIDPLVFEKVVERRADTTFPLHAISFMRLTARASSPGGVFCVFLTKPCSRTM